MQQKTKKTQLTHSQLNTVSLDEIHLLHEISPLSTRSLYNFTNNLTDHAAWYPGRDLRHRTASQPAACRRVREHHLPFALLQQWFKEQQD